jgi:hypothetical protein
VLREPRETNDRCGMPTMDAAMLIGGRRCRAGTKPSVRGAMLQDRRAEV